MPSDKVLSLITPDRTISNHSSRLIQRIELISNIFNLYLYSCVGQIIMYDIQEVFCVV